MNTEMMGKHPQLLTLIETGVQICQHTELDAFFNMKVHV